MGRLLLYPGGIGLVCRSSVAGHARGCRCTGERPVSIVEPQADRERETESETEGLRD